METSYLPGVDPALCYRQRVDALQRMGVALWDVLEYGERSGSSDAKIHMVTAVPNDFTTFFAQHPSIELVCLNGKKAADPWARLVDGSANIPAHVRILQMPSTSPANTRLTKAVKLKAWRSIAEALQRCPNQRFQRAPLGWTSMELSDSTERHQR